MLLIHLPLYYNIFQHRLWLQLGYNHCFSIGDAEIMRIHKPDCRRKESMIY
jgi:hypothetical protein